MKQSNELDFWEQIENYDETIISVFKVQNHLTKLLKNYPMKKEKEIIDFGCGMGNAIPYIADFKKVYAIDFSENMLSKAKNSHGDKGNIEFIKGDLMTTKVSPVDVILAASSIWPQSTGEFNCIIENLTANLKPNGEMIMVLPSFEAKILLYQLKIDQLASIGTSVEDMKSVLLQTQIATNFNPLGYLKVIDSPLIQKQWLKEEILYRLKPFNFKTIKISKLDLEWGTQVFKHPELESYPRLWFWQVIASL